MKNCCQSVAAISRQQPDDRTLRYESLEDRCVLSANALGVDVAEGNPADSPRNSDAHFDLTLTPVQKGTAFVELSESVAVNVNAVADGGFVNVADFAIVTGVSGSLPYRFSFGDLDASEQHTVTFDGLPDFISLSAGEKVGNSWVLQYDDLAGLQIRADRVSDTSGCNVTDYGLYQRFDVSVTIRSVEQSNGSFIEDYDEFTFLAIQRV